MYRRQYLGLREAVGVIAELLAKTSASPAPDAFGAAEDARQELIQALYDGAVRAEGVGWELVEPDPYELEPVIPADRRPIARIYWANEKSHETKFDESGSAATVLDSVTVLWDHDGITWDNELGVPCAIERIHIVSDDIEKMFSSEAASLQVDVNIGKPSSDFGGTGVAGRPTSRYLALQEMNRRAFDGKLCETLAEEVRELRDYLQTFHPSAPQPKQKSLENSIRGEYRKLSQGASRPR
jgi:hypothetical protein